MGHLLLSIVFMKNVLYFTEWLTTHSVRFLACHHEHNVKDKKRLVLKY